MDEEQVVDQQVVERAKIQGWVPKEEFKGDPNRHISAEEFVSRADNMMPILKATNKKLEAKNQELEQKLSKVDGTLKKIVSIQEKYSTDLHQSKIEEIREKKRQAVRDGDEELYTELEEQEGKIKTPEPIKDEVNSEAERWISENKWFNTDLELQADAIALANAMEKKGDPLSTPGNEYALGEAIKEKLKRLYPEKFHNPAQQSSDFDEGNTHGAQPSPSNGKGWNDMPREAQQQCANLVNSIPGYTKEKYINDYFEE